MASLFRCVVVEPGRHLRVVEHDDNGEVIAPCTNPECRRRIDEIAGLERDIRGWAVRYQELKRDRNLQAEEHPCWNAGKWLFGQWKYLCGHPRARWSPDRFWLVEPFLQGDRWGKSLKARLALCRLAIEGAQFDAFEVTRKNGGIKRFDEWERIFASSGSLEEFVKRAPEAARARCAAIREAEGHRRSR
jgi:hypothetical protein